MPGPGDLERGTGKNLFLVNLRPKTRDSDESTRFTTAVRRLAAVAEQNTSMDGPSRIVT